MPAVLAVGHFFYGAYLPLPSQILVLASALILCGVLTQSSVRRELSALRPLWLLALLFIVVIAVGVWTLTPFVPGGPHPIWSWAGLEPASTIDVSATILELIKLAGFACLFVLGCSLGSRSERARTTVGLILTIGFIQGVVGLISFASGSQHAFKAARLSAGFYSPNTAGTLFGVLLVLAVAWLLRAWRRNDRARLVERITGLLPATAAALLFFGCLLLTASRAATAATLIGLIVLLAWDAVQTKGARWLQLVTAGGLLLIGGLFFVLDKTPVADRIAAQDVTVDARVELLAAHWKAFLDSPLLGYGLGSFSAVNNQMMTVSDYHALSATTILHNAYVQWLEEGGLIGAVPMFVLVALILGLTTWRTMTRRSNKTLLIGIIAASLVVLVHAAFDVSLQMPSFAGFWALLLGLGFSASQAPSDRG